MKKIWDEIREDYKDLFNYSLDLIFIYDINGNFIDANEKTLQTLGYKKEELLKISINNITDKSQNRNPNAISNKDMESRRQSNFVEFRIKKKMRAIFI